MIHMIYRSINSLVDFPAHGPRLDVLLGWQGALGVANWEISDGEESKSIVYVLYICIRVLCTYCMCIYIYLFIYVGIYVCIYIYIFMWAYIYMLICTCISYQCRYTYISVLICMLLLLKGCREELSCRGSPLFALSNVQQASYRFITVSTGYEWIGLRENLQETRGFPTK